MTSATGAGVVHWPRALRPGQDEQAGGVAPHPGREVVELEEVRQPVGSISSFSSVGDEAELLADQVLVAPAEVRQRLERRAPLHRLLDGEP